MCLAHPMKIVSFETMTTAICDHDGVLKTADISFLEGLEVGDWVTVHIGIAREKISEADAKQIADALLALDMVKRGETDIDYLFADIVDREPPRPPTGSSGPKG